MLATELNEDKRQTAYSLASAAISAANELRLLPGRDIPRKEVKQHGQSYEENYEESY